jgi:glycosyltransferase involved in cell wall biosynthesis
MTSPMTEELVSIIITNHNYGTYLSTAIESALDQTYRAIEVVVVDDGSTDGSRDVITRFGGRIVPVLQKQGGQGAAFNAGFKASRGAFICMLDADDAFLPTKVERVVEVFSRYPTAAWLRHKLVLTDEFLTPSTRSIPNFSGSSLTTIHPRLVLEHKARFVVSSGIALRRVAVLNVLPIPEDEVALWQLGADAYVGTLSAGAGPGYSLDEILSYYRQHRRLGTTEATTRFLELNIRFERQISAAWSKRFGRNVTASDVFKHSLILDALAGHPLLSRRRLDNFAAGLNALPPIALHAPSLAIRQALSLTAAFVVPRLWIKRMVGHLGFG